MEICHDCGSARVSFACWVDTYAGKVGEAFNESDCMPTFGSSWCEHCQAHVMIETAHGPTLPDAADRMRLDMIQATRDAIALVLRNAPVADRPILWTFAIDLSKRLFPAPSAPTVAALMAESEPLH